MPTPKPRPPEIHLLVYGALDSGVTDSLRIGSFVGPLAEQGIEVRSWASFADDLLNGAAPPPPGSRADLLRQAGLTALAWSDVVLFRRWRSTHPVCTECETGFSGTSELGDHARASGHRTLVPEPAYRALLELLSAHPELLGERAIVYDTDDDVLDYPAWTGLGAACARERDLSLRLLGMADVVTVATPVLGERLRPHVSGRLVVVRNAVDPAWYQPPESGPADELRIVYHGVPVRLRDYELARPAVDALAAECPKVRRVWLGAANEPRVVAAVDEALPWADGLAQFGAALAAARPDIGLAPLLDEPFNRAKSELHWLEYSLAGAASVVTALDGPGPYGVIRDGVDGLLVASRAGWLPALRRLAASPGLRAELTGRARERVLADYTVQKRAGEWAETYRWAASHGRRSPRRT